MRDLLRSSGRWLRAACFWPLVLLALPNCTLDGSGLGPLPAFDPGPSPASSAIICEIPKPVLEGDSECATQDEIDSGETISLTEAATALATGVSKSIALDWSQDALATCNKMPRKIEYEGTYPDGLTVCLNCGTQIPAVFANPTKACIAKCKDLVWAKYDGVVDGVEFCGKNARTAVNYDKNICYDGACTDGGNPFPGFFDPRRNQEPVKWIFHSGTEDFNGSNSLKRIADTTGSGDGDFNAGAASAQIIREGDGWVEFEAGQIGVSHVLGLRESCSDPNDCPDNDPTLQGIGFAIRLTDTNMVEVLEHGTPVEVHGPFGLPYAAGERFRVTATDNHDGTATISYSRLVGTCIAGTDCTKDVFYTHVGTGPTYPLRVDATFREQDATLVNVTLVRIKP